MGSSGHEEAARGVFWAWVEGATGNMALAFEGLVEQVRSWVALGLSGLGLSSVMDTLNTLLVGWMVFVALILIIGTFFYFKFIHHFESSDSGRSQDSQPRGESQDKKNVTEASSKRSAGGGSGRSRPAAAPPAEPARKPTIVPDGVAEPVSSPVATGADPDAARWTNNIFTWLYNSVDGGPAIKKTWLHTINENTVKTALETGILVEVVEIYKSSPAPVLSNMVVDCSPTDNLTITCDCDATIYLRIVTTRTQGEKTTESEYACAVRPLRGRLNIAIITSELMAVVKFDGWPEVSLKLEGIRNNASGFDEQQMLDVIDEVLTSALRNSVLDVNFQSNKNFPRFRRARQVPDPIIPVGYDSMVRELQTHPPSVSRKPKKPHGGSVHDEEIVEAGESFTALNFSSNLSQGINLTTSEEQLIARNLHKYPSLENSDIGDDISEICKSWEENYVPATGVPNEDKKKVEVAVGVFQASSKEDSKTQNFVLVASNRSKLIDEPRTAVSVGELEEEEPELVPILKRSIEVEPCIRRGGRSPLVLGKPKVEEPEESVELEEEDLENFQLDRMNLIDKSLTSPSGTGPLPSLPGLQKGPFVSEACCVGVKVGVADEVPELELRFETAPVDDCVACDLSECDQEVVVPIQPLLQIQLHNQPAIDDLSACSIFDTANTSSGTHKDPIPIPISFPTLEPDISSASALSAIVGNTTKHHSPISSCVINREEDFGQSSGYLQDTSLVRHEPGTGVSSAIIHKGTDAADNYNERDNTNDAESLDICSAKQVLESQEVYAQDSEPPSFHYPDNLLEEELENVNEYKNISGSKNEVCKLLNKYKQDNESLLINNIIQGDELRTVNNSTQDDELRVVNNNTQDDEFKTVNNNTQDDERRTVNNLIHDDELRIVNNNTQDDELRTVKNSILDDELRTVNNNTQDDELRMMNNNIKDDELRIVNNTTQDDELRIVNNNTQDDELRTVNNSIQDDELRMVNNSIQGDEFRTVSNSTQADELWIVNNGSQDDELRIVNGTQEDELGIVNNGIENELRIMNNGTQDDDICYSHSQAQYELGCVNNNTHELWVSNNDTQKEEFGSIAEDTQENELVYKKMCLNKFSESLFRHIDSEESEISLPEEVVGDQNWEMVEAYEALDESATFSDTSDEEGKDCVATDNDTENLEVMSDSNEAASEDSHSEVCCDADVFRCQKFEKNKFYLETEIDIFNVDEKTRILPSNNDAGKFVSTYQKELFNDSDSLDMISEEETVQYDYVQLKESSSDDSDDSSTDDCTFSGSENMASYDLLHEIDDVAKTIDDKSDTTFIIANTCSIKSSVAYEKLEDQTILDNILISSADKKTVEEQTSDNEEYDEHTKELEWNSNVAVEPKLFYNKELWKGPQEGLSTEAQKSLCNNSQKVMNERVKFLDSMLNGSVHKENIDTKINPVAENVNVMTVSLPEENGLKFNDDQICGIPDEPKCVDRYTFLETSSDSEIEGITGKHPGKYSGDSADDTSPCGQNWRYSDIDLIIEAESFVFPSDHVDSVSSCNLKKFQEQHQSVQGAQALSRDTILNTSFEDSQSLPRISKSSYGKKNTQVLPQESAEIDVQSTNVTFSGPLTATVGSVATLTQSDTSCALTLQQSASHTRKACPTWDEIMKSVSFTSGQIQWTQPLPSYPVYGTSYLVSSVTSTTPGQPGGIPGLNGKRLLVKIVKATGVGCDSLVSEAYAVVEMDEPPQKFSTSVVKETSSPFWDEQFLFDLSGGTLELLFEVYDKKDGNFLGLGIVGIEELVATPSQRQIIPLQSRPYENDEVSGSLTVEFLFLDRADLPEHTLRSSATSQSLTPKGDLITTTTTTYVKAPESQDVVVNGGDGIAAAVLRDIEGKKVVVANNASKSTMIIHASRKPDEEGDHLAFPSGNLMALTTTATTTTPTITTTPTRSAGTATGLMPTTPTRTTSTSTTETTADGAELNETDERGRSRGVRRKRDSFFGTLKKRFSRSKVRSKSVDPSARDTSMDRDASVGRSVSVERSSNINRASGLLAVPANVGGDGGSTRSSLSDASAISGSSTRTYVNEASTLIIETSENGVFKHYLIPLALQQKSKWRKKGLKLHIFGEHTFVAKHMSSSTPCEVCQKTLGRRFGKQGYVCRDCGFKCHKPCHVKTEAVCPNSTVNTMDLEYVKDSREERRAWHRKAIAT